MVVVFDRFLGWPHVVIEVSNGTKGVSPKRGTVSSGSTDCTVPSGPDDDHQLAALAGRDGHAVPHGAPWTALDEEQIGARLRKLRPAPC